MQQQPLRTGASLPSTVLARMYAQRNWGGQPQMLGIANPQGNTSGLRRIGSFVKTAVESLDPRFILSEGGRSVERAVGDIAAIPGVGRPSSSPTADAYRSAGGGLQGVVYAGLPYVNLATTVGPFVASAANRAASNLARQRLAREFENVVVGKPWTVEDYLLAAAADKEKGFNKEFFPRAFDEAELYYGQHFPDIQNRLRRSLSSLSSREERDIEGAVRAMDNLFQKAPPLTKPLQVYRGVKNRGYYSDYGRFVENLQPGDRFTDPGFWSTSIDPDMAKGFSRDGYVFEVNVPSQQRVLSTQSFYDDPLGTYISPEREVTLPRNSQFEVVSRDGNRLIVRLMPGQR